MVGMALFFLHKYLTLMMEASLLPWKVQCLNHGMGSVTVNGEDRLAMFGCTWHDQKTFSLEAFNIVIVVVYGTKMYFNLMCMYGTQKGAYLKPESNLYGSKTVFCGTKIELYRVTQIKI